jgi:hypothetical protein
VSVRWEVYGWRLRSREQVKVVQSAVIGKSG